MREIGREMEKERDVAGLTLVDTEKEAREGSDEGNGRKDGEKERRDSKSLLVRRSENPSKTRYKQHQTLVLRSYEF